MLEVLDNGMPITMARKNMIPRVAELMRYYAGWATKIHGETIETSVPGDFFTYTLREPVGVVGAIVPWNGPLITATWKLAPALAAELRAMAAWLGLQSVEVGRRGGFARTLAKAVGSG